MKDVFKEISPAHLETTLKAAEAVADLVHAMLADNEKEHAAFIEAVRGAFAIGAIKLRVILDFTEDSLTALKLQTVDTAGRAQTISQAKFQVKAVPAASETLQ